MHHTNNAVIMQTEQLGQIEALEEELHSSKAKMVEMEQKMTKQDWVIAQLVGDNLDHLQDNMQLTAHIDSSNEWLAQMEHRLGQVGSVVMGFLEGRLESLMEEEREEEREEETTGSSSSLEVGTSGASGDIPVVQDGGLGQRGRWCLSPREYEAGQSDTADTGLDRVDGEGGGGSWTWGVVQWESGGHPRELEWVQLRHVGQSGSSPDDSPDHYWWPNLA